MGGVNRRDSWISILVAVPGLVACLVAVLAFFWRMLTNGLPFHPMLSAREHYQAVGRAYSGGFLTGFFLCFFLVLAVVAVSVILTQRRGPRLSRDRDWPREPVSFPKRSA